VSERYKLIRSESNKRIILEFLRVVKNIPAKKRIKLINKAKMKPTFFKLICPQLWFFQNVNNKLSTLSISPPKNMELVYLFLEQEYQYY
jgi:hypothetical protein